MGRPHGGLDPTHHFTEGYRPIACTPRPFLGWWIAYPTGRIRSKGSPQGHRGPEGMDQTHSVALS